MKTTIDILEGLLRQAKAAAALRGVKLNDLITELVQLGLNQPFSQTAKKGINCAIPVIILANGQIIPSMTNVQIGVISPFSYEYGY
jgi:hypothetical protein